MGGRARNIKAQTLQSNSAASTGVTLPSGITYAARNVGHERLQVYVTKIELPTLTYSFDTAGGGANDGVGQKIATFPQGHLLVHGAIFNVVLTPQTGLSAASVVCALGSTAAADNSETLTTTEADLVASHTFGDGTLASATAETHNVFKPGTANTSTGFAYYDGSTTAPSAHLNIAGVWTEADDDPATATVSGNVKIVWSWLGDD